MLKKVLVSLVVAAVVSLGGWVWNISAQVAGNTDEINRRADIPRLVPELRQEIAVVKNDVQHVREEISELKQGQKELLVEIRGVRREVTQ